MSEVRKEVHTMMLLGEHEKSEHWVCPICGRSMFVRWKPKFKRIILEKGNTLVGHSAFKSSFDLSI